MTRSNRPTVDILKAKEVLAYDEISGEFTWLVTRGRCSAGKRAGTIKKHKNRDYFYRCIQVFGVEIREHRLAWAFVHNQFPGNLDVDHINGDATDNRIVNLRLATRSQNMANAKTPCTNTTNVRGVYWDRRCKKWLVQLSKDNKQHYLGVYASKEEAERVAINTHKKFHGDFSYECREKHL